MQNTLANENVGSIVAPLCLTDDQLATLSDEVRAGVFEICIAAQSGHIGGSSGAVELMVVLYFGGILRFSLEDPQHPARDRVLVRGHLGPLRYKIFSLFGWLSTDELLQYRRLGSRLQGHEDHDLTPGVDITPSGSLGMLLSYGVGCAMASKDLGRPTRTFVFLGDGEEQEGNVSEAARHAAHLRLANLIAVLDANSKQLADPISETDSSDVAMIWRGYGWNVVNLVEGHSIAAIRNAYLKALDANVPTLIIASTTKGRGLAGAEEHFSGYHTIATCPKGTPEDALRKIRNGGSQKEDGALLVQLASNSPKKRDRLTKVNPEPILQVCIRPTPETSRNLDIAQGEYLRQLDEHFSLSPEYPQLYFLTADVTKRDDVDELGLRSFSHYLNVGLREQHMLALTHGLSITNKRCRVLINSFDAFTHRSLDQLHALCEGGGSAIIISDIAGLTNSRNGRSHQTSSHLGTLLQLPRLNLYEPGDIHDLFNCLNHAFGAPGVYFIRTHSSTTEPYQRLTSDQSNIHYYTVHGSNAPVDLSIVASGLTVSYCILAAKLLENRGIRARVVNVVSLRTLDDEFVKILESGRPTLTVYNGDPLVLESAVATATMRCRYSRPSFVVGHGYRQGTSGTLEELIKHFELHPEGIATIACRILERGAS